MARPRTPPGQLGTVGYRVLPTGRVRASAYLALGNGVLRKVAGLGRDRDDALLDLRAKLPEWADDHLKRNVRSWTVADLCESYLTAIRSAGKLAATSIEKYESTICVHVQQWFGAIRLVDLDAARVHAILQAIARESSPAIARRVQSMLSNVFAHGLAIGAMAANPVRDLPKFATSRPIRSYLEPDDVDIVLALIDRWEQEASPGRRPDYALLRDVLSIVLGTSMRIGEVLALQQRDFRIENDQMLVDIRRTQIQLRDGSRLKDAPKHSRQRRRTRLPGFAAEVVRRRLAGAEVGDEAFLFATANGTMITRQNFSRLLRSFRQRFGSEIEALGIPLEEFTLKLYRRTVATSLDARLGVAIASKTLGHSREGTTRDHYSVALPEVPAVASQLLDELFGARSARPTE